MLVNSTIFCSSSVSKSRKTRTHKKLVFLFVRIRARFHFAPEGEDSKRKTRFHWKLLSYMSKQFLFKLNFEICAENLTRIFQVPEEMITSYSRRPTSTDPEPKSDKQRLARFHWKSPTRLFYVLQTFIPKRWELFKFLIRPAHNSLNSLKNLIRFSVARFSFWGPQSHRNGKWKREEWKIAIEGSSPCQCKQNEYLSEIFFIYNICVSYART